ncbi:hypothetical protein AB0I90_16755 [Micromonospora wenchangensis]|uniref:hypothetical protein n=1 Tax=Micromonospora wenchangensis TaxID=1185415 RepID=UPI0033EA91E1
MRAAVISGLAGAEAFLSAGGPWWFGFHQAPAGPANAQGNRSWAGHGRLTMPVTAVDASTVGDAPARQLTLIADHLDEHPLPHSGHLVPVDAPDDLAAIVAATATRATSARA